MRKGIFTVVTICLVLIVALGIFILKNSSFTDNNIGEVPIYSDKKVKEEQLNNQQLMNSLIKHIGFAEEALGKFSVNEAEEAAKLWSEAMINGNGVLQFALMDSKLQNEFKNFLTKNENISWDTRSEDETINSYEILEHTDVSEKIKLYKIKFNYTNKNGVMEEAFNTLTVVEENEGWVISAIR